VLTSYLEGALLLKIKKDVDRQLREDLATLKPEEAAVLGMLEARLNRDLRDQLEKSVAAAKTKSRKAREKAEA
jgi:DNA topoisomerase I